ncbi:MAG: glycosyltransferase family 39 protein [Candidatus Sumerlaeota bacterium]|nr:glycosyltransferase family 39 protein [Candidatus Sumerlaeota bacterium]
MNKAPWLPAFSVLVFCAVLCLTGNGGLSVVDRDEARFSLAVKEMRERSDWIVPTNWGEPRYHKPILIYWLALGAQEVCGPGDAILRLPSAMCGLLTCFMTIAIASSMFGICAGWRAGLILATALFFVIESKICTADASLLCATTLSFWAWAQLRNSASNRSLWQTLFWFGVGMGLLAKVVNVAFLAAAAAALAWLQVGWTRKQHLRLGILLLAGALAVAIPKAPKVNMLGPILLACVAAFWLIRSLTRAEGRGSWSNIGTSWGIPLALGIMALWLIPALIKTHGEFLIEGAGKHLIGRTTQPFEGHVGVPGYYLLGALITFFPWSAFLPAAIWRAWKQRRQDGNLLFLLAWVAGPWVLIELITSKLPHYLLSAFPAMAILIAYEWEYRCSQPEADVFRSPLSAIPTSSRKMRLLEAAIAVIPSLALSGASLALMMAHQNAALTFAAATTGILALIYATGNGVFLLRGRCGDGVFAWMAGGAAVIYLALMTLVFPAAETLRISRPLALAVSGELRAEDRLIIHKFDHASLGCYLPRTPELIGDSLALAQAMQSGATPTLAIIPNGAKNPRLDKALKEHPFKFERVATVRGYILPEIKEQEVWLIRNAVDRESRPSPK